MEDTVLCCSSCVVEVDDFGPPISGAEGAGAKLTRFFRDRPVLLDAKVEIESSSLP